MTAQPPIDPRATAAVLSALGEPTRVRIVQRLAAGDQNVSQLAAALGVEMPNVVHHLGVMRAAGVVRDRKVGGIVWYSLVGVEAGAGAVTVRRPGLSVTLDL